ncbi:MAG TPA: alpha-isopropylmalate synthase regulatory domain-containing protein, partial [Lacipirellulaceae bacterium]|nr:alpha-isopropylmalate synthase regulatory domain-containing protein [Lacipirellulaceae bacterium]
MIEEVYERCTGMSVDPRHPYAGELVFTAFSGSHQDAIKKALAEWKKREGNAHWDVPYLAIDPHDIGRTYSEVIRVNSQSGKGGVAYLLESKFGIDLPKEMQREFGPIANDAVDGLGREVSAQELKSLFWREYIERQEPYALKHFHSDDTDGAARCQAHITRNNRQLDVAGIGNGPIAAFANALQSAGVPVFEVCDYREQAMGRGVEASAIAYICIRTPDGTTRWGAGVDTSIELASIKAVLSALNRL